MPDQLNIAHIVCRYPPYYSGMGTVVFQTASELARLGHRVQVFTPEYYETSEIREAEEPSDTIHEPVLQETIDYARRLKPSLRYGNAARLHQVSTELDDFDIVHLHYPFFGTANLVRRWKQKHPEKPLVITYHMDPRAPSWKGLIFKLYAQWWMPRILDSANMLIASSLDYLEHSDARGHFKEHRQKWVELPFGIDIETFQPRMKPRALFHSHNLEPEMPLVLFVGGMDSAHYFKGIPVLLKALKLLKETRAAVLQTVFVGDGNLRESFETLARSFGIYRQVRFVGHVPEDKLPSYYNMADLLVLPSVNTSEAFGMVLLEAMASGVPVLASDLAGVRTVARDGGVTFAPGDYEDLAQALLGYFLDPDNEETWKQNVRAVVEEKYAWPAVISELDGWYRQLAGRTAS